MMKTLPLLIISSCLAACGDSSPPSQLPSPAAEQQAISETQRARQLYDQIFDEAVDRDPLWQTYLGIKKDYDKWHDLSEQFALAEHHHAQANLQRLQSLDQTQLSPQTLLSHELMRLYLQSQIDDYPWRHHSYPVNQMFGTHSEIPAFLINQHSIANHKEALDYIARVKGSQRLITQLIEQLQLRADKGIIAPKFVFAHVIRDSKNLLNGQPFAEGKDSTLLADFKNKLSSLELSPSENKQLLQQLQHALLHQLRPAYQQLISYLEQLAQQADNRAGVWKLPDGEAFYNHALAKITTTTLNAEQIHNIGLQEVARIHSEMRQIMQQVGFKGELRAFFDFMRQDPQFYYPETPQGRDRYLREATALIDDMQGRLEQLFLTQPKAQLKVKRVEAFREKSAGKAFYQMPAPDGSRPGIYYANLYDMASMPSYQMAALAYHEGIPGHHMQIAIKQEMDSLPKFRKFEGYTAYTEGWGLYSEMLPKEIGLYQDPYADFGRLAMELWRACRLVVDTGIHAKRWTRQQGIDYYANNTPNALADAVKMVERHIVMPAQATAYKIGMLKIIELREKARLALGQRFDIREYHDVVLRNGSVPLTVLEQLVDDYIAQQKAGH
ncbi:DUF885 domain-containing protein [Dasania sp. GY-MA-18]|uniref:DUF885 domain-containing protein n=1 Tax=Dasania phycosphaerae TaxID=2950436 RepID=A0A9J6RIJ1_9GAMM|nr:MULTISPECIES: DUF885 domain-containing protein [Dasania]MCR8922074.1 DUF885 domain-containing protein [Dasania sp. GY-MA-18]MCZ0864502.1 DUF885 domain-containing protein [Dasania phycosphaerae]MCZ0868230.1 DUF885 domain-containing protein [Dasania phycosphaerae]